MRIINFRNRKIWSIVGTVLGVLALCTVLGFTVSIFANEKTEVPVTAFHIGGIDAEGNYEERNDTLYTKDLIECQGLEIEPVYDSETSFKVFFYDNYKRFLEATDVLDGVYNDAPATARYCRIMLMPNPADGVSSDEFEIGMFEVWGYANDIKVTVNKKQNFKLVDIFAVCMAGENSYHENFIANAATGTGSGTSGLAASSDYSCIGPIDCSKVEKYIFIFDEETYVNDNYEVFFFNATGGSLGTASYNPSEKVDVKITVPEDATSMYVNFLTGEEFVINEYLVR